MILGVGCDILMVSRIASVYRKFGDKFLDRILVENEKALFYKRRESIHTLAKLFSAKESAFKSIGVFVRVMKYRDIEVSHGSHGEPSIILHGDTKQKVVSSAKIHLSISDEIDYVMSYAVCAT